MNCDCVRVAEVPSVSLETLLRHLAMYVPTMPYDIALDTVRQSYIEFARRTNLLIHRQSVLLQRDVRDYALEVPEGYVIYSVMDPEYRPFPTWNYPDAHTWWYAWGTAFRIESNYTLVLKDAPSKDDDTRDIVLRLLPSDCAMDIPEAIASPFGYGIAMGALANMMEIANKPWTDRETAKLKRREFYRTVQSGRAIEITNRGAISPSFKPVRIL